MLNIPESIKTLFKTDGVKKNFRVHFPNGELSDITNDNVVKESLHFTESICSQDTFRFGLAEASVLEFETVGVGNMYGMTIEAAIEIGLFSLSAAEIAAIEADPGDGSVGVGKNLLPSLDAATTVNGVTWTPTASGSIIVNGRATGGNGYIFLDGETLPAGTYTANSSVSGEYDVVVLRKVSGGYIQIADGGGTFTIDQEYPISLQFRVPIGRSVENVVIYPQIEQGSSATYYEPYQKLFSVPLGVFRIESCPRNHGAMAHRRVTAYGENYGSNKGMSPIEAWKLRALWNASEYDYASVSSLVDANIGFGSKKYIDDNYTRELLQSSAVNDSATMTANWRHVVSSTLYYAHVTQVTLLKTYFLVTITPTQGADTLFGIERVGAIEGVTNNVTAGTIYGAIKTEMASVPGIASSPLESVITSLFNAYGNDSKIVFDSGEYSFRDPQHIVLLTGSEATVKVFEGYVCGVVDTVTTYRNGQAVGSPVTTQYSTTQNVYIADGDGPEISKLAKTDPLDMPTTLRSTGEIENGGTVLYSFAGAYSLPDIFGATMELSAQFGRVGRTGDVDIFALDNSAPAAIIPGNYEEVWWDEYDVDAIGSVIVSFTDPTVSEQATATIEIGAGSSIYDMSENQLFQKLATISLADLTTLLSDDFAINSQAASFTPVELTMQGWPWIEAGDALEITAEDGTVVNTYALRVEMSGIQYLTATITAQGGEIISSEATEE